MTSKSDAKVAEKAPENAVVEPERFDPNAPQAWSIALGEADEVLGFDLAKDEILDALEGVPFLITRLTFREAGMLSRDAYVSCEAQIAPKAELERRRVDLQKLPFDPGELVVFNDGSTGVYRQIVQYLAIKGFITLPHPVSVSGPGPRYSEKDKKVIYECSYDLPPELWTDVSGGEMRFTPNGKGEYVVNVRLFARRGIRISEYQNDWTQDGKTRYLA